MKPMDHWEQVAKLILEAAIPGSVMTFRTEQSHMEYDFDLRYPNGEVAAVEATSSMDQTRMQTSARIFNKKKGGSHINPVSCKKSWRIYPLCNEIRKIREKADEYLARLEAEGLEEFDIDRMHGSPECVRKICVDLNLRSGMVFGSTGVQPVISITGILGSSAVDATTATEAGEKEAEANKEKLGKAQTNERHIVVYIHQVNSSPFAAFTGLEPPSVLPNLPDEITHIWLVTEYEKVDRFVVWHGSKNEVWRKTILPKEKQCVKK
jgi:hypothetical protein